jgi:hypothetical protein
MGQFSAFVGFFCVGPIILMAFGFWLGRGAPGFPWKLARRAGYDDAGEETSNNPYGRENNYAR